MKKYLLISNGNTLIEYNGNKITDGFKEKRGFYGYLDSCYVVDAGSKLIHNDTVININKESVVMVMDGIGKRERELIVTQDKNLIDYYKRRQEYIERQQQEKTKCSDCHGC